MTSVRFTCGHGAPETSASVILRRNCPVCMLLHETHRDRRELVDRVAPGQRRQVAAETRIGAVYDWRCERGHDRFAASVVDLLTGPGCPKCLRNAAGPTSSREAGLAYMNHGLRVRTSMTEQRLRAMLSTRVRLHHQVNTVRIARTFYGRQEVWPDILVPQLRIAIEYDDPGRSRRAHLGLKEASDSEKDAALREVGWEVIRVRGGGLDAFGPYCVVARSINDQVVDEIVRLMSEIRGQAAVDAIRVGAGSVGAIFDEADAADLERHPRSPGRIG